MLHNEAETFIRDYHASTGGCPEPRIRDVHAQINNTGTYQHTAAELTYAARVAWRNAARCIGRLYWQSLTVRDRRNVSAAGDVATECTEHLKVATNGGRIRPVVTVFAPDTPEIPGPRIINAQLIRYAGWRRAGGVITGDPLNADLTEYACSIGWDGGTGGTGGRFDILPLVIQGGGGGPPELFELPPAACLEVPITHPRYPWFAGFGLRWHAVPVISGMYFEAGGIRYPAAPFSGWYMGTEIGARNLGDTGRYDLCPQVAECMGLDVGSNRTLWRDTALVELNVAVLHSFDQAKVTITDHHTESGRFLAHLAKEELAGRECPADWSWIVPPISGSATGVFHRSFPVAVDHSPGFFQRQPQNA